jgi:hypothetical protein
MIKTYRSEGDSDPTEEEIIHAGDAANGSTGYSIDTYDIYTNHQDGVYLESL